MEKDVSDFESEGWGLVLAVPCPGCAASGKVHHLSVLLFPPLTNGNAVPSSIPHLLSAEKRRI